MASAAGLAADAAKSDGAAYLMTPTYALIARGMWNDRRWDDELDGGAPSYDCYRCADAEWIAIAPLGARFFDLFARAMEPPSKLIDERRRARWPGLRRALTARFLTKPREARCALIEATDVCFAPVLSLADAPRRPHNQAWDALVIRADHPCPAPAPRLSETPSAVDAPGLLLSPHVAGDTVAADRAAVAFAREQMRRHAAGEPLENVVSDGY